MHTIFLAGLPGMFHFCRTKGRHFFKIGSSNVNPDNIVYAGVNISEY